MGKTKVKLIINILVGFVIVACVLTFYNTFSLDTEYKFESAVYDIGDGYIENVSSNTSVELYLKYFDVDNCSISVVDKNNETIVSGFVGNGSKTIVYDNNHNVITSYVNVIKGDYTGDGLIDMNDFYDMGKCLVSDCLMDEYLKRSVDVDDDGEFRINDLVLLDKAVTLGYTGIIVEQDSIVLQSDEQGRLVGRVEPGYGVNLNVKWSSDDEGIATVDDAGRVTGHIEGNTVVRAVTLDGKYMAEVTVKVDNTIQLESYSGIGYIGGNDVVIGIKSIDYEGISCSVSNEEVASCEIRDKSLVLVPKNQGSSVVTVTSSKYGEVTYNLEVRSVYFNIMPKYICNTPGNVTFITVSGFNTGDLTFEALDNEIITSAYMETVQNRRMLRINFGTKQGRTTLRVTESNGNSSNLVIVDVTSMRLSDIGKVTKVGEEVTVTAIGDNLGSLTCKSNDVTKGTCRVEGNNIIVTPLATGSVTVDVYNNFSYESYNEVCGQSQFIVVIQE